MNAGRRLTGSRADPIVRRRGDDAAPWFASDRGPSAEEPDVSHALYPQPWRARSAGRSGVAAVALLAGLLTPVAASAVAPAVVIHEADASTVAARSPRSLLLVLEIEMPAPPTPKVVRVLDARIAAVPSKALRGESVDDARSPSVVLLSLFGTGDAPLLVAALPVETTLHGPRREADGSIRCVGFARETVVTAARLPLVHGARRLEAHVLEADFAPRRGAELADSISVDPAAAGLRPVARHEIAAWEDSR